MSKKLVASLFTIAMLMTACGADTGGHSVHEADYDNENHVDNAQVVTPPVVDSEETEPEATDIEEIDTETNDDTTEQQEVRIPANLDMSEERLQQFYDFFEPFLTMFGVLPTLGDYDSRAPESEYVALEFVLSTGIFTNGRWGNLGLPYYGFAAYIGGEALSEEALSGAPSIINFEFLSTDYVDARLLQYFGIEGFNHASIQFTEWFGFEYHNGRYYYAVFAQGCASPAIPHIFEIDDNGEGLHFVRIQYLSTWWNDEEDVEYHVQYNMAVVEVFEEAFRLLYWQNDVARDAQFPVF